MKVRLRKLTEEEIKHNRKFFLSALRSGQFKKGTTRSDDRGLPVIESDADQGNCACAIMCDLFYVFDGVRSNRNYLRALNLTPQQCRFIQQDLNDSPLTFPQIADAIEQQVFGLGA